MSLTTARSEQVMTKIVERAATGEACPILGRNPGVQSGTESAGQSAYQ
jgi:hypothetical protein